MSGEEPPRASGPARPAPERRLGLLLGAAGVLVCAVTVRAGIAPNDEGLMLAAARRIAGGQVPYRDFWWFYPPGQPYLLGGLWAAFGPSLMAWRVVRVLCDALVAVLAYRLARRRAARGAALAAWASALLAMAYPATPHPFPIALACALGALLAFERHPAWAGALAGACAWWRIEFAAYLALGVLVAQLAGRPDRAAGRRAAGRFLAAAAGVSVVLYAPVVAAAGLGTSWRLLVRYPLLQFSSYQGLPFPLTHPGPVETASVRAFLGHSAENLLLYYLPAVLVAGALAAAVRLAVSRRRDAWPVVATAVFTAGMVHYLVVRPDLFHTAPLGVMAAVVAAWAIGPWGAAPRPGRLLAAAATSVAAVALAYGIVEGLDRQRLVLDQRLVALRLPAAAGVRVPAGVAAPLQATVRDVDRRVAPGSPIYVIGARADLVTAGAPLLYVLAGRDNATPYDIAAPGVVNSAPVEREIVADLERRRVGVVVRWTDPVTAAHEPNRAGRSSGVALLDDYLGFRYRVAARYGSYVVMARGG